MIERREQYDEGICTIPPEGWWCSRAPGHDGPCAARPIEEPDDAPLSAADEERINQAWEKHKAAAPWKWQPIETAPRDGTGILVIDMASQAPEAGQAWFKHGVWTAVCPDGALALDPETFRAITWPKPTHWMPLPPPPASDANPASSSIASRPIEAGAAGVGEG